MGEMIRLAGVRLDSVVLIAADKSDESLGLMRRTDEQAGWASAGDTAATTQGMRFGTHDAADGRPASRVWRRIFAAIAVVVVVFGAVTARLLVWPAQGMPARVSAIVMLAGPGDRLPVALELARQHRAPVLVVSRGWQGYGGPCPHAGTGCEAHLL